MPPGECRQGIIPQPHRGQVSMPQIPGSLVTSSGCDRRDPLLQSGFRRCCIPATFRPMRPATQKRPPPEQQPQPRPRPAAPPARRMPRWLKRLAWIVLIAILIILLLPYLLVPLYRVVNPVSTLMLWRWANGQRVERSFVPIERMAPALPMTVIASEDGRFCSHRGVDWKEIRERIDDVDDISAARGSAGAMRSIGTKLRSTRCPCAQRHSISVETGLTTR